MNRNTRQAEYSIAERRQPSGPTSLRATQSLLRQDRWLARAHRSAPTPRLQRRGASVILRKRELSGRADGAVLHGNSLSCPGEETRLGREAPALERSPMLSLLEMNR